MVRFQVLCGSVRYLVDQFEVLCRSLRCFVHQFEVLCRPLRCFSPLRCLVRPVFSIIDCILYSLVVVDTKHCSIIITFCRKIKV